MHMSAETNKSIVYLDQLNAHHEPAATIEDIKSLYEELNVPFELSASADAFTFKHLDFVYLTEGEFNDYSLYSLIQLNDQHENTKFVKTSYDLTMPLWMRCYILFETRVEPYYA